MSGTPAKPANLNPVMRISDSYGYGMPIMEFKHNCESLSEYEV